MSKIHITVETYAGGFIPDLIRAQCELANQMGVDVHSKLNGVTVIAKPGDDPVALAVAWEQELHGDRPEYAKIACLRTDK